METMGNKQDIAAWMESISLQLNTVQLTLDRIRKEHLIVCPNTLFDVVDIANMVKMSPKAVYNWVYKEKVKSIKIGGRRMFFVKDLINPKDFMR